MTLDPVAFDRIATDRYDETRGGEARGTAFVADLRPYLRPGTVLEVGVGTGIMAAAVQRAGWSVLGVDLALPMLARARDRLGGRVMAGDARALPLAAGCVDNVLFCAVLHLIGGIDAAFAQAARVLRTGGRVLAVYGRPIRAHRTDMDAGYDLLAPLTGRRADSAAALDGAAAAAGLSVVADGLTTALESALSPAALTRGIEERIWSYLWRCTPAEWAAYVTPALAALRALPDQERPRPVPVRHAFRVYERVTGRPS